MMMMMCYAAALCLDCDAVEVNGYFMVAVSHFLIVETVSEGKEGKTCIYKCL